VALPTEDIDWVHYLSLLHDAELPELERLDDHYEGEQPLAYIHPEVLREVDDRIKPVVLFWPEVVVGAVEERLDFEGFRLPDKDAEEEDLWRVWQANNMDEQTQQGHVDALVMRRYYVTVGSREGDGGGPIDTDTPILAAESPLEMYADIDPRTRKVRAALRRVREQGDIVRVNQETATLYLPDRTVWYERQGEWREIDRDEHGLGEVPVVPVVNRGRLSSSRRRRHNIARMRRLGKSDLDAVIPLSDAANKIATDMMLTAEGHAMPVRGFWGLKQEDMVDEHGNQLTAMQAMMRKFLTLPLPEGNDGPQQGREFEFRAADLSNFHQTIELLAKMTAAMAGLPQDYLGLPTDNPPSAESRLAGEIRLIKRAERKQRAFGGSYERVGRLVRRFQSGSWDPTLRRLEAVWRDASTPTVAQRADSAVKLFSARIVPKRQTREDLGYTDPQIRRMEAEDEREARLDPVGEIARGLAGAGRDGAAA
jgi:hypothetical protein